MLQKYKNCQSCSKSQPTCKMNWDKLIESELLCHKSIIGICLIIRRNTIAYSSGCLKNISSSYSAQFSNVFRCSSDKHEQQLLSTAFKLPLKDDNILKFNVFHKSMCSVYATCSSERLGLVVCYLPYGTLICVHDSPRTAGNTINAIETFSSKLRSWRQLVPD